ncbi:nuclear transport factor 2 family protein [Kineosporia succinea]|uniref:Ketosteroid isomerase-like protein n=1 Tax=Kineosporia succinea TaxID=84632 RepID=A0ABT9P766_9ACTN|nr:nuclear transport factor 2 family protein [Kineosporia succinea]MDP9828551.1 ketosteroid isomerase-like protein [Kineosporia succinea]
MIGLSEVVRRYLSALNTGTVDAAVACVSEGFVNEHTSRGGVTRRGRAAYAAALPGFLADFAGLRYEPECFIEDGARVAVPYVMTFRPSARVRGVFVFTLDPDGLIAHRVDYWDSAAVRPQDRA